MPSGLSFIVQAILGMMRTQNLLHVGALSVRLSEGFLFLMTVCSVRSSCVLYLVVVSMVVLSQAILCPVFRKWSPLTEVGRSRLVVGVVIWVVKVES